MEISREWSFGNDELAEKLCQLVLVGKKTATTGLYKESEELSKQGDYAAILDKNGKRFCMIQYTNVEVKPFLEVTYDYAVLEGERDKDIEEWREGHRKFFKKYYPYFTDDSLVVCEKFKLVQVIK
jgi:uncharacterized protein YhfF